MGKREEKDFKDFLKERGLTRTFKIYQSMKGKRRIETTFNFPNYDGHVTRKRIVIVKEKGRTVVRDKQTLKVLASSKRKPKDVLKDIFSTRKVNVKSYFNDKSGTSDVKAARLRLRNDVKVQSYNKHMGRLRTVTLTNRPLRKRYGNVVVDVVVIGAEGERKRVQARSRSGYDLAKRKERQDAINDAVHNAFSVAGFSPVGWEVKDFWFEYRKDEFVR